MKIFTRPSFDRALKNLSAEERLEIKSAAVKLSEAFGKPHIHAGIGLRRVGKYFEFRAGMKLRVLFVIDQGDAILVTVGNHDDIARFVRS